MAQPKKEVKKPKRRLKAQPTFREQSAASEAKAAKPSRIKRFFGSKIFAPFQALGIILGMFWRSPVFKPLRFLGRILVPKYFRNAYAELKLVAWPANRMTWRLTFAVIVFTTTLVVMSIMLANAAHVL